ncbi:17169_t:CDS:1, partial [Acaulospora morrowiae]
VVIDCYTSTVTELNMTKNLIPRDAESPRWVSFTPVPQSCSSIFLSFNPKTPKAPRTLASPTQNSFVTQNFLNSSNSLSRSSSSYSGIEKRNSRSTSLPVPPTESQFSLKNTSTSNSSNESGSDSDDDSQQILGVAENLFICTISNVSHIVNIRAEPYAYSRPIRWASEPNRISLLPTIDDIFVVAFENQLVEVGSTKTGKIVKTAASGAPVKYLGESWRKPVPQKVPKKYKFDEGIKRYTFWSCEMGDEIYIYRGDVFGIN